MKTAALRWEVFANNAPAPGAPPDDPVAEAFQASADAPHSIDPDAGFGAAPSAALARFAPTEAERPAPPQTPAFNLDQLLARARGEGRAAGFEEGVARAEADFNAERRILLTEIGERMQDAYFSREKAREELAAAMRRMAEALLGAVAPALAQTGLAAEVAAAAAAAATAAAATPGGAQLIVRIGETQRDAVAAALAEAGIDAKLEITPGLGPLRARVDWASGFDEIDLDACISSARAALDGFFHHIEEKTSHG